MEGGPTGVTWGVRSEGPRLRVLPSTPTEQPRVQPPAQAPPEQLNFWVTKGAAGSAQGVEATRRCDIREEGSVPFYWAKATLLLSDRPGVSRHLLLQEASLAASSLPQAGSPIIRSWSEVPWGRVVPSSTPAPQDLVF